MTQDSTMTMNRTDYGHWKDTLPEWPAWAESCDVGKYGNLSFYGAAEHLSITDTTRTRGETLTITIRAAAHYFPDGASEGPYIEVLSDGMENVCPLLPSDAAALAQAVQGATDLISAPRPQEVQQ